MKSYEVLKELDEQLEIFGNFDNVLLIGFGDGGFVQYSSEKATKLFGIDSEPAYNHHKTRFDDLKEKNVTLIPGDVFTTRPLSVTKGAQMDIMILNLPLNIFRSLRSLQNFLPALKQNGKVLISLELEGQPAQTVKHLATRMINEANLTIQTFQESMIMPFANNNLYVLATNAPPEKELEAIIIT